MQKDDPVRPENYYEEQLELEMRRGLWSPVTGEMLWEILCFLEEGE